MLASPLWSNILAFEEMCSSLDNTIQQTIWFMIFSHIKTGRRRLYQCLHARITTSRPYLNSYTEVWRTSQAENWKIGFTMAYWGLFPNQTSPTAYLYPLIYSASLQNYDMNVITTIIMIITIITIYNHNNNK